MINRTRLARTLVPLALAAMALSVPTTLAQDDPTRAAQGADMTRLDLSFKGGTMQMFVDAIRESVSPDPLNIILQNDAASLHVPSMELRSVSIATALEVAVPQTGRWMESAEDGGLVTRYRDLKRIGDPFSAAVFVIDDRSEAVQNQRTQTSFSKEPESAEIEIFSLERLASERTDVARLLTAIDTALSLSQSAQKAEIKHHADSALLITRGTQSQLEIVERVVSRFHDTSRARESDRVQQSIALSEMRAQIIERRADIERNEARYEMASGDLRELVLLADKELASRSDVREAEAEMRMLQAELEAARARFEAAEEKFAAMSSLIDRPELESKTYPLRSQALRDTAHTVLRSVDGISGHISSVGSGHDGSRHTVVVEADKEGHEVVARIINAIQNGG